LLLERVFHEKSKEQKQGKAIILVGVDEEKYKITIGRGAECDVREADISVSRLHATIRVDEDGFWINDNSSKYGTLVLMRDNIKIEGNGVGLQIGRNVMMFGIKNSSENIIETENLQNHNQMLDDSLDEKSLNCNYSEK